MKTAGTKASAAWGGPGKPTRGHKGEISMMPLSMARPGETVTIRKITGKDDVRQHLAEMGFVVNTDVTVVNELGGSLIIQVKDSRVALDRTMANRVMI